MNKGKITVVGIGPGNRDDITPAALSAIRQSDVIIGYNYYFQFIQDIIHPDTQCIDTGMKREKIRAEEAYKYASEGKTVTVISSGDAGIYGMAPLIYEMRTMKEAPQVEIEVVPGISAFQKAASLLGAPIGHDLCIISLSDLMTPWLRIEKRIRAAAIGDFVTAIYNPKSEGRYWQLHRLKELFLEERVPETPVGYVRQAGREEQVVNLTTLAEFDPEQVDMFTVILIGNSQSYEADGKFITPRGYYGEIKMKTDVGIGQDIMIRSFRTIEKELKEQRNTARQEMGFAPCHPHDSRFRYGKYPTDRRSRGGFPLRKIQPGGGAHHHHRRHNGCFRHPQRSFAAYGDRGEMLFARRAHRTTCNRKRDHPHTSWHPACRTGTSQRFICIRQCADRINGTL